MGGQAQRCVMAQSFASSWIKHESAIILVMDQAERLATELAA